MRFYNQTHDHYCGIDLHVKPMSVCILDATGRVLVHRNVPSTPEAFLEVVAPYRQGLVVAVECMFTWYWLADEPDEFLGRADSRPRTPSQA